MTRSQTVWVNHNGHRVVFPYGCESCFWWFFWWLRYVWCSHANLQQTVSWMSPVLGSFVGFLWTLLTLLTIGLVTEELKLDYVDEKTGEVPTHRFVFVKCDQPAWSCKRPGLTSGFCLIGLFPPLTGLTCLCTAESIKGSLREFPASPTPHLTCLECLVSQLQEQCRMCARQHQHYWHLMYCECFAKISSFK